MWPERARYIIWDSTTNPLTLRPNTWFWRVFMWQLRATWWWLRWKLGLSRWEPRWHPWFAERGGSTDV